MCFAGVGVEAWPGAFSIPRAYTAPATRKAGREEQETSESRTGEASKGIGPKTNNTGTREIGLYMPHAAGRSTGHKWKVLACNGLGRELAPKACTMKVTIIVNQSAAEILPYPDGR
jgi:hypothetical protein